MLGSDGDIVELSRKVPMRALVVEDVHHDLIRITTLLESLAFSVEAVVDPDRAKFLFLQNNFDIAVVHIRNMPNRGLEFTKWMRSRTQMPILMFTDKDSTISNDMCLNFGADDFMVKPINKRTFAKRLNDQLDFVDIGFAS